MNIQIRQFRELRHMTQQELADLVGASKRQIGYWEKGNIGLADAAKIADVFEWSLDELAGRQWQSRSYTDPRQTALNGHFETFNETGKTELATIAERMSFDPQIRIEKDSQKHAQDEGAMGA